MVTKYNYINQIIGLIKIVLILIAISIIIKLFVFEFSSVISGSMEDTVKVNDIIIINKLAIGPILPRYYGSFPWLGNTIFSSISSKKLPYFRLKGYRKIKKGDIIVFLSNEYKYYLKRVLGCPGDTLHYIDSILHINGSQIEMIQNQKNGVLIQLKKGISKSDSLGFKSSHTKNPSIVFANLTKEKIADLKFNPFILNFKSGVSVNKQDFKNKLIHTNRKIIIPFKGQDLSKFLLKNDYFYSTTKYDSKKNSLFNYYFIEGDNKGVSIDSRDWGLISEEKIIGVVDYVIRKNSKEKTYSIVNLE